MGSGPHWPEWLTGLPWKDIVPWFAIAVNLCWNCINTILGREQWRRGQRFTEFRSLKAPIDVSLGKLRETRKKLQIADTFGGPENDFVAQLQTINKELVEHYTNLTTALEACDASDHWPQNDLAQRYEAKWDVVIGLAEAVYSRPNLDEKRKSAKVAAGQLNSMIDEISREIEGSVSRQIDGEGLWIVRWIKKRK